MHCVWILCILYVDFMCAVTIVCILVSSVAVHNKVAKIQITEAEIEPMNPDFLHK